MPERRTTADYLTGDESLQRRELLWGMVREAPAPFWPHQEIVTRATVLLHEHVERHSLGAVVTSPIDVVLDRERGLVVQPDVLFLSSDRLSLVDGQVWGAPDLVVEVESTGTRQRDRVAKRRWYRHYGVREYWLIDAAKRAITVFAFDGNGRSARRTCRGRTAIRSVLLPALDAPASRLFPPLDRSR